jgi:hypothetical protein
VWRQTGKKPQQLGAVDLQDAVAHVWRMFCGVHPMRDNNGMEVSRITAQDVKDWCWFNGVEFPDVWERKALLAIDNAWMEANRKDK